MDEILRIFEDPEETNKISQQTNEEARRILTDRLNLTNNDRIQNLDINITNHYIGNRWQTIVIVSGILLFGGVVIFLVYRLCTITARQVMLRHRGNRTRRRKRNRQEEAVDEILSNSGARQVLSSLARTAINSQANRRVRDFSSQASITSGGDVLDISERVVRVSFAPAVASSEDDRSIGGESSLSTLPPAYDTLGTPPPPVYPDNPPPNYIDLTPPSSVDNNTPTPPPPATPSSKSSTPKGSIMRKPGKK